MTNIILFDGEEWNRFLPFTFTRPIADIRCGILTISEKWEILTQQKPSFLTAQYLRGKFPAETSSDNLFVRGSLLPNQPLRKAVFDLHEGQALYQDDQLLAVRTSENPEYDNLFEFAKSAEKVNTPLEVHKLAHIWDIFKLNPVQIKSDFELITRNRKSQVLSDSNRILGANPIFIEEGASIECCILNSTDGPIYIGKDATVMEGSIIQGPFALCNHSTIKIGAKIYPGTTIGPHCKVGGEVNNSVFFSYSNKGHDGFLGNAVIGEWCNIGADSNNSNLKNNYDEVKIWSYEKQGFVKTGEQFCGLMMGDHSKCGINTMFNTGTVVGVSANIYGGGFPRVFLPSFSWGGSAGLTTYKFEKAMFASQRMMERRKIELTDIDRNILQSIFDKTAEFRK